MTIHFLAVTGGGSIGKCGRLSQLALSVQYIIVYFIYYKFVHMVHTS